MKQVKSVPVEEARLLTTIEETKHAGIIDARFIANGSRVGNALYHRDASSICLSHFLISSANRRQGYGGLFLPMLKRLMVARFPECVEFHCDVTSRVFMDMCLDSFGQPKRAVGEGQVFKSIKDARMYLPVIAPDYSDGVQPVKKIFTAWRMK